MNKLTIEEMKDQLVKNEVNYVYELVLKDNHEELFNFIYTNSFRGFKNIDDNAVRDMFADFEVHE